MLAILESRKVWPPEKFIQDMATAYHNIALVALERFLKFGDDFMFDFLQLKSVSLITMMKTGIIMF